VGGQLLDRPFALHAGISLRAELSAKNRGDRREMRVIRNPDGRLGWRALRTLGFANSSGGE
jgi:hypothetical protein